MSPLLNALGLGVIEGLGLLNELVALTPELKEALVPGSGAHRDGGGFFELG